MLGHRSDIADLCKCADLFLFPSFQEGLPVAVMEAISTKIHVACSRIRGNIELTKNGLFDPYNTDDILAVIEKLLYRSTSHEITTITENNFKNLQRFNIDIVNNKLHKIYKNILQKSSATGL